MKLSNSIQLVMQLAAREAIAADFSEIRPEHIFNALSTFAELPEDGVGRIATDAAARQALLTDIRTLREEFLDRSIDTTAARRTVRIKLGKGTAVYAGGELHRTPKARQLFDSSARLADKNGDDTLAPIHLLESVCAAPPTILAELLTCLTNVANQRSRTPCLDAEGQLLGGGLAAGSLPDVAGRKSEVRAVLSALADHRRPVLILVSEPGAVVRSLLRVIARDGARLELPRELRHLRFVELTSPATLFSDSTSLGGVAQELAQNRKVVLYVELRIAIGGDTSGAWLQNLKQLLQRRTTKCVCEVSPEVFRTVFARDTEWKALTRVMEIGPDVASEIPDAL